jgi:hypothetical protein
MWYQDTINLFHEQRKVGPFDFADSEQTTVPQQFFDVLMEQGPALRYIMLQIATVLSLWISPTGKIEQIMRQPMMALSTTTLATDGRFKCPVYSAIVTYTRIL